MSYPIKIRTHKLCYICKLWYVQYSCERVVIVTFVHCLLLFLYCCALVVIVGWFKNEDLFCVNYVIYKLVKIKKFVYKNYVLFERFYNNDYSQNNPLTTDFVNK